MHPCIGGAYWMGYALWQALKSGLPVRRTTQWVSFDDDYDPVTAPTGNLIPSGYGTLFGTGGTNTPVGAFTPSGDVATGWTVTCPASATSTTTCVSSKENPRTDGPASGVRQKFVFTTTGAGTVHDQFYFRNLLVGFGSVVAGETLVGEMAYELVSGTNVVAIQLSIVENGPSVPAAKYDGNWSGVLPGIPDEAHSGLLRTAPLTLAAGSTSVAMYLTVAFDTTSGSAAAELFVSDARCFKVS